VAKNSFPLTPDLAALLVGQSAQITLSITLTPAIITALAQALGQPAPVERDNATNVTPTPLPASPKSGFITEVLQAEGPHEDGAWRDAVDAAMAEGARRLPPAIEQVDDEPELSLADFGLGEAVDAALAAADAEAASVTEQPTEDIPAAETADVDSFSSTPHTETTAADPLAELRAEKNPGGYAGDTPVWLVRVQDADGIDVAEQAFVSEDDAIRWAEEMDRRYPDGTVYLPQAPQPLSAMYPDVLIVPASQPTLAP
jgi:hypothetical protein